jgi:Bacterial Ig-like domain (group 2)
VPYTSPFGARSRIVASARTLCLLPTIATSIELTRFAPGAKIVCCLWLIAGSVGFHRLASAQCVPPSMPTKENMRLGDRIIAVENATLPMTVNPFSASLNGGQTQQFTANITNSNNQNVTWSVNPALGSVDQTGLYTAPARITELQTVTVSATSTANSGLSACGSDQIGVGAYYFRSVGGGGKSAGRNFTGRAVGTVQRHNTTLNVLCHALKECLV